jgi:hypothetical protein
MYAFLSFGRFDQPGRAKRAQTMPEPIHFIITTCLFDCMTAVTTPASLKIYKGTSINLMPGLCSACLRGTWVFQLFLGVANLMGVMASAILLVIAASVAAFVWSDNSWSS